MKTIVYVSISLDHSSLNCYQTEEEVSVCEYSSEWFQDGNADPIIEYVENALSNAGSLDGYEWDLDCPIKFNKLSGYDISHVLFYNGTPIELYWVADLKEEGEKD